MSKIEVNTVDVASGSTLTIGSSGKTITIPAGTTIANSGTATGFGSDSDISWQSVVTSNTTMVANRGYFVNTTSGAITMTLPSSATLGDTISIKDYAGTFATNNLTIGRNSHKIQGASADLTVGTERAAFGLVYVDSTQGWLLTEK